MFLQGLPIATVTYYVTIMTVSCSAMICVSFGTTISLTNDTTFVVPILLIRASLGSVETGLSHIRDLASVVQVMDSAIHQINHHPLDNSIGFAPVKCYYSTSDSL